LAKDTTTPARLLSLIWDYLRSVFLCLKNGSIFDDLKYQTLFIGCPKSGHSLIGSLLDAHPDMIVAHELGFLKYLLAGFHRRQIYSLLLENSRFFSRTGRREREYLYDVPNQWQGRFRRLYVIGDKHGEGLTLRLQARPWLMQRLKRMGNVKFIHVIRNPYDSITSLTMPKSRRLGLESAADYYCTLCETVQWCRETIPEENLYEFRHEDFIKEPALELEKLCRYLGLEAGDDYLNDCASIVFESPNKTRLKKQWSPELIDSVNRRLQRFSFLEGYTYGT
jgi:hypothetical protein